MLKFFNLPEPAEGVEVAVLIAVLVKVGETVEADQIVAELENEKATAELPVPFGGVVCEVHKKAGDEIRVGELLLTIEIDEKEEGELLLATESAKKQEKRNGATLPSFTKGETPVTADAANLQSGRPLDGLSMLSNSAQSATALRFPTKVEDILPAGPEVRRMARELGVDLHEVCGTGPRGRISPEDVRSYTRSRLQSTTLKGKGEDAVNITSTALRLPDFAQWGAVESVLMTGVRRKTAEVVMRSWREIPHVVQHDKADITELGLLRKTWQNRAGDGEVKVTVTAILLKVVAAALKVFPKFNCSVDMDHNQLVYKRYIHIAVAVDASHGLLTPVIQNADRLGVFAIAEALAVLSTKARNKQLSLEEMAGSTFAVSNLGGFGTTAFAPIVTWPHVGVLGVGKAEMLPVWTGDEFVPRKMLPLSLSYDHRANDGADAARFLRWISEALEDPMKIIIEAG